MKRRSFSTRKVSTGNEGVFCAKERDPILGSNSTLESSSGSPQEMKAEGRFWIAKGAVSVKIKAFINYL
jgi:hypothetical protein